jgi:nitrilase
MNPLFPEPYLAAAVQATPVFLNLDATIDKAVTLIDEAARNGARLIAFPETWIPTYPSWIFGAAGWGDPAAARAFARLHENSLMLGSPQMKRLQAAAKKANAVVVMGANEKIREDGGSLYNSQMFIGTDGAMLGVHRKLMPTYTERNIWAYGDGSTMTVADTPLGRVGGLICWEHWMPLARFAMHNKNEHVHVAAWPEVTEPHKIASRHYAFEGRCYVICVGSYQRLEDIPRDFELYDILASGLGDLGGAVGELLPGGSGIIGPDGEWIAGPISGREVIVYGQIDVPRLRGEKLLLDTAGHYNRPDVFKFAVDDRPKPHVTWMSGARSDTDTDTTGFEPEADRD